GAEREASQTEGQPCLEACSIERRRVRLERHLSRSEDECAPESLAEPLDLVGIEQARCSPAEEECSDPRAVEQLAFANDLAAEGVEIPATKGGRRRGRCEIAVRAARGAEGHMDVEADTAGHRVIPSGLGRSASEESSAV